MLARDRDCIGQIEFALAVVVADPLEDRQRGLAGERHQPAIAQSDGALGRRRVELLADGDELVAFASPAGRSRSGPAGGSRAPRWPRPSRAPRASARSVCGRISGVSPKMTRTSSAPRASAVFGRQHRMRGAAPLASARRSPRPARTRRASARDGVGIGPDHDRDRRSAGLRAPPPAHARAATARRSRAAPSGRAERMRVPSPAASTIARQVRSAIDSPESYGPAPSYPSKRAAKKADCAGEIRTQQRD